MGKMSTDQIYAFLTDHAFTGHLATVREDGRPHVATIWYIVDGEDILFTTWHSSVKGRNLQRTGYAALSVTDDTLPFTGVEVEGPVELLADGSNQQEVRRWAGVIGGRYMGAERAEEFGERNGIRGEVLYRLRPVKLSGIAAITA